MSKGKLKVANGLDGCLTEHSHPSLIGICAVIYCP